MTTMPDMDFFEARVVVNDEYGIHARPAATVARTAQGFNSGIKLIWQEKEADAKSILDILSLAVPKYAELIIHCRGKDAEEAGRTMHALFLKGFPTE